MKINSLINKILFFISLCFSLTFSSCTYIFVKATKILEEKNKQMADADIYNNVEIIDISNKIDYNKNFINIEDIIKQNNKDTINKNTDTDIDTTTNNNNNIIISNKYITVTINKNNNTDTSYETKNSEILEKQFEENNNFITSKITSINSDYFPDSIIVNVTIKDNNGVFISGLASPYLDTNKQQDNYWKFIQDSCKGISNKITNIKVQEIREIKSPLYSICYVLDHSSSMGETRAIILQQSVRYSISKIKDKDKISAIKFTSIPTIEVKPTNDKEEFKQNFKLNGMDAKKYGAGTNILKALDTAVALLKEDNSDEYEKIIILFTDFEDFDLTNTSNKYDNITKKIRNNKIKVFTICYGITDFSNMIKLAKNTDGQAIIIKNIHDFANAFQYIYNLLTNFYKITYIPPVCNDLHNINVVLDIPELNIKNILCQGEYDKSMFNQFSEVGSITLMDIEFDYNKATISQSSLSIINDIATQLNRNTNINIKICGHTDSQGSDEYNLKLSLERANSVKKELVKLGIKAHRISVMGYGKTRPIAPNDTEENKQKNRRTEFIIVD